MSDDLIGRSLEALEGSGLADKVQLLVMAALLGDDSFQQHLDGRFEPPPRTAVAAPPVPQPAYLTSISARGFRGIGAHSTLKLPPGPGLTLVVGRNGSGKSSFAEALEFILTKTSLRWSGRSTKTWQDGWRNLHETNSTKISADFAVDGHAGAVRLAAEWPVDGALGDATFITRGADGNTDLDLGWADSVVSHRPLLSYPEMAKLAEAGPSALYDSIASILGLEELTEVLARVSGARIELDRWSKALKATRDNLVSQVAASDDERAAALGPLVTATKPDLDNIEAAIDASVSPTSGAERIDLFRRLVSVRLATLDEAAMASDELSTTRQLQMAQSGSAQSRSAQRLELLAAAMAMHQEHGDQECPVCHHGSLDAGWRESAIAELKVLAAEAEQIRAAEAAVRAAMDRCRRLVATMPEWLIELDKDSGIDSTELAKIAGTARACSGRDDFVAAIERWPDLVAALDLVQAVAETELGSLDNEWHPIVELARGWVKDSRSFAAFPATLAEMKAAETWVKDLTDVIRGERFDPIATRVKSIWDQLRQASNVSLDRLELSGAKKTRRVDVEVSVDGSRSSPFAVMSQGELNALALSLFLPRATLDASPFGFMVIDDPVQALDPSRVDALARVLADVALTRQVVVFTHDDRLPDAVRNLELDARVIEVRRGDHSEVTTVPLLNPVTRCLNDARAIVRSDGIEPDLVERVVAGLCRQAAEAAAIEVFRSKQLKVGADHQQIESIINAANTFNERCALALWSDPSKASNVLPHFHHTSKRLGDAAAACARGAHGGTMAIEPRRLPEATEELCQAMGWAVR